MKLSKILDIVDKKQRISIRLKKKDKEKEKYYDGPKDVDKKYLNREVISIHMDKEGESLAFTVAKKGVDESGIKSGNWKDEIAEVRSSLGLIKKGSEEEIAAYNPNQDNDNDQKEERDVKIPKRFQKDRNNNNDRRDNRNRQAPEKAEDKKEETKADDSVEDKKPERKRPFNRKNKTQQEEKAESEKTDE